MKPSDAGKIVAMLITAWPDSWRFLSDEQQLYSRKLYREFLADLEYPVADAAVRRLVGSAKKMPSVAEIRAVCMELTDGRLDRGGEAWGRILKLIGRYGINRRPRVAEDVDDTPDVFEVSDPILARVISAMGWRELCLSENQPADRARVIELYEQLALQFTQDRQTTALAPIPAQRSLPNKRREKGAALADIVGGLLPEKSNQ